MSVLGRLAPVRVRIVTAQALVSILRRASRAAEHATTVPAQASPAPTLPQGAIHTTHARLHGRVVMAVVRRQVRTGTVTVPVLVPALLLTLLLGISAAAEVRLQVCVTTTGLVLMRRMLIMLIITEGLVTGLRGSVTGRATVTYQVPRAMQTIVVLPVHVLRARVTGVLGGKLTRLVVAATIQERTKRLEFAAPALALLTVPMMRAVMPAATAYILGHATPQAA